MIGGKWGKPCILLQQMLYFKRPQLKRIRIPPKKSSVVRHKSLYFDCHSGLNPESSLLAPLDSCFRRNDRFDATLYVKKCWTHYTISLNRNWDCPEGTEEGKPSFE